MHDALPIYVYVDPATRIRLVELADDAGVPRAKLPALLKLLREDVKARIGESNNSNLVLPYSGIHEKPIRVPNFDLIADVVLFQLSNRYSRYEIASYVLQGWLPSEATEKWPVILCTIVGLKK